MASITHRPGDVSCWQVRWRADGRERSKRFRDRKSANQFLGEVERRAELGAHAPEVASTMTLGEWLERWIATDGIAWQQTTLVQRARLLSRWCLPYIGDVRLRDLGVARLKTWRAQMLRAGASANTINHATRDLSSALSAAAYEGLIPANPLRTQRLRSLPQQPSSRRAVSVAEVEAIRNELAPRDQLMVSLMAYGGLRPAEVLGLQWGDFSGVDLLDGTGDASIECSLVVARSVQRGKIVSTKTGRIRYVPVARPVARDLHVAMAVAGGATVEGADGSETVARRADLMFRTRAGTPIDWNRWSGRVWRPVVRRLGMDYVPYELRHTFASLMIAEGRTALEVASFLGHSSPAMTLNVYGHLFAQAQGRPGERMEQTILRVRDHVSSSSQ